MARTFVPLKPLELKSILVAAGLTESPDKALQHGIADARHCRAMLHVAYANGILRAATRVHAATIIMGSHGDSLSELAVRVPWSIANRVNREAMFPVLTVRG